MPGLAAALPACSPPTKPQPVDQQSEAQRKADAAHDRTPEVSTKLVAPGKRDEPLISAERIAHYEELAKTQGKRLEDVTPAADLELIEQQQLRDKRLALAERKAAKARGELPTPKPTKPPAPVEEAPDPYGAFPGDPPFIDGYNPEEESCVSGNWCGAGDAARAISVPSVPAIGDCPSKIGGGKPSELIASDTKTYAGLSAVPNMQGSFNEHGTELARERGNDPTTCCYHWFEYCSGRPHLGQDGPVVAQVRAGDAWGEPATAGTSDGRLPEALRQHIAQQWLQDARAEHASVAAFARAALELMAVGAPPELLAQALAAAQDEVEHARRCFELAGRYGGAAVQPGPLPALAPRPSTIARLAADTFAEGCVGETIAALAAQRAARDCADPRVRECLETIADDEARHAALAWSTVAWALKEGGAPVARELRRVAASLRGHASASALPPRDERAKALAAHGRLDARAQARAETDAWEDLVGPMLASLLDGATPRAASSPA